MNTQSHEHSNTPPDGARERIPVGVLGATGAVGQRFLTLLADHPWFEPVALFGSQRSAGKPYREAATWMQEQDIPESVADLEVRLLGPAPECRILFSALEASAADKAERELAAAGHFVVSNARSHRMDPDVPLVVPEVNPEHLGLVEEQKHGEGAIITNPNCSTIGLVCVLKPLQDAFGIRQVRVVTLQALSGAGFPGVSSLHAVDNVVPYISGEEDKLENEPRKILGTLESGEIHPAEITVSAQCNRVPVIDGHLLCISVELDGDPSVEEVEAALREFRAEPQERGLPTAPETPVVVTQKEDRPQPRVDRSRGGGMAVTVGRVRPCPLGGYQMVALSHNTLRGAAGGAILLAELAVDQGLVPEVAPFSKDSLASAPEAVAAGR
ncbi:MAG: aspartate-semialdehyde dehydrogenase [Acidobacteriota bacterium]|nr:aspartate-semialdehyde dehydrogenase [Acidobacteriota bacterium]